MAVKIKLKRMGKIRSPHYRIIVADSRNRRNGRAIEEIGLYNPMAEPSMIRVNSERVQYWLGVGAQPTEPVAAILRVTGDWQQFKGLPGAEGTLKVADAKADKRAAFDAALAEIHGEPKGDATTAKKKPAKKSAAKKDDAKSAEAKSGKSKAEEATAEQPKKDAATADDSKAAETTSDEATADGAVPTKQAAESTSDEA